MDSVKGRSVLVAGGAGFIGSHLVDRLLDDEPARIVVVDNYFLGREENLADAKSRTDDLVIARLDAANLAAMQDVADRYAIDVVFDLAVIPLPASLDYPDWTVTTNVGIATTFCELARRGMIDHLVHVSSSEVYGSARYIPMDEDHPHDALTPYAASKSAGDLIVQSYVKTFGITATIVRPFNNIGPRQNPGTYAGIIPIIVRAVQSGQPIEIHGDGLQTRDFIYVRQTADLIVRAFASPEARGRAINVASGRETTILELVERILQVMGAPSHPIVFTDERPGDVRRHCADVSLARAVLGYEPATLTDDDLAATVDWYLGGP